MLILLQFFKYT